MREIGLTDVAVENVDVHGWRFRGASVSTVGDPAIHAEASSFGGVTPTAAGGVTGRVVAVGTARRSVLDGMDLRGAVVLAEWRSRSPSPYVTALEVARRGAVALVVTCPARGPWWQSDGALGAFDGHWPAGGIPMVFITKDDAVRIAREARDRPVEVRVTLHAEVTPRAAGHNTVGYLAGSAPGPIVVGAHHDGWFRGAFDDASGVAVLLAIAKALVATGWEPAYSVCFTSRTGEEFGIADSSYDWCIGAWEQIATTHPRWADESPFHLCLEATGWPDLKAIVEAPIDLAGWSRRVARAADREGWWPNGWRLGPPVSGTEMWPYLVSGVPSVATYSWETTFAHTDYHSQFDTPDRLDYDLMATQARAYSLFLVEADRDPDAAVDHTARARQLSRIAAESDHDRLLAAADRHRTRHGRPGFTAVGRHLVALDAKGSVAYPHEQSQRDLAALDTALEAIDAEDAKKALQALAKVGDNGLFTYASDATVSDVIARSEPAAAARSWARNSHLTPGPNLWTVMAGLAQSPGSRPAGPWLRAAVADAADAARAEMDRRLDAMAEVLDSLP